MTLTLLLHAIGFALGIYPVPTGTPITYQFFSGSCIVLMALWGGYRRINCHVRWCPFVGRYDKAGGQFKVCRVHSDHPRRITHAYIRAAHQEHVARTAREPHY